VLVGNVDCSQVLPVGAREELTEAAKGVSARPRPVVGISSAFPAGLCLSRRWTTF